MSRRLRHAFTLIEVLVSVAILSMTMALVAMIYSNTINAWRLAQGAMDELHQGDFVIEQVMTALRSATFFQKNGKIYGFWLDDNGTQSSAHDEVSFVTSSSAFMPSGSPFQNNLHRIFIGIDSDDEGREGLAVRALPHMKKDLEKRDAPVWVVSTRVSGFDCQVYDFEKKSWSDDWDNTNKVPNLVKVTMSIKAPHEGDPPLIVSRVIEIPIATASTSAAAAASAPGADGTNAVALPPGVAPGVPINRPGVLPMPGGPGGGGFTPRNPGTTPRNPGTTPRGPSMPRLPGTGSGGGGRR